MYTNDLIKMAFDYKWNQCVMRNINIVSRLKQYKSRPIPKEICSEILGDIIDKPFYDADTLRNKCKTTIMDRLLGVELTINEIILNKAMNFDIGE